MPSITLYAQGIANAYGSTSAGNAPNIDFLSDDMRLALVTSSYTPNVATDAFWSTPVANEITGTGYTANGTALASKTLTVTIANSWSTSWAASTARTVGDLVRPTTGNTYVYVATTAGTNSGAEPTWPTVVGATVTDGGVIWANIGRAIIMFDAADVSWTTATLTARYGVIYNRTPGTDATRPLFALIDFDSNTSSTASTFQVTFPTQGLAYHAIQ